jgi:uncharacterized protein (TIGR01777 family)
MRVVVTGASGLIGTALGPSLRAAGHEFVPMARRPAPGGLQWDPGAGRIDAAGLEGADAVVHLAGAGIGDKRWNAAYKRVVFDSRVQGTTLLAETIAKLDRPPAVLVSGSAVGFYGDTGDNEVTEAGGRGAGFLGDVCEAWEAATAAASSAGVRVAHIRTGIVLTGRGGALKRMLLPFRLGVGGRLGSGRQWFSWISLADEVGAIEHILAHDTIAGPVNLTAPVPVTNAVFTKALGKTLHRPAVLPVPAAALKAALGAEMAHELLLMGQRVRPQRLTESGYRYAHPEVEGALRAALADR